MACARSEERDRDDVVAPAEGVESVAQVARREYGFKVAVMFEANVDVMIDSDCNRRRRYAEAVSSKSAPSEV